MYPIKSAVTQTEVPPISESFGWVPPEPHARQFITLSQAVPSYPPAEALQAYAARRAVEQSTSQYTDILGIPPLRDALARHFSADYEGDVTASDVAITSGCNQAFCLAVSAIASPGDNIIIPSPWFFNHQMWLDMQHIEVRATPCRADNAMVPDIEDIASLIDERTRAILLVTPNNPTGAIYPPAFLEAAFDLAQRHGIALITDETYKDFRKGTAPPHPLFARPDWRETLIHLYSFSKTWALPGYRVGAVTASPGLISEVEKLMDCIAICAPRIAQDVALFALENLRPWAREKSATMAARADALVKAFAAPELDYRIVSCGAFFAYVAHPFEDESAKSVAMRLSRDHGLLILPGSMFGKGQEQFLRIAFANAEADLMPDVVARLIESQTRN